MSYGHLLDSLSAWGHSVTLFKPEQARFRLFGIWAIVCASMFFPGRLRPSPQTTVQTRQKEGVTRISKSKRDRGGTRQVDVSTTARRCRVLASRTTRRRPRIAHPTATHTVHITIRARHTRQQTRTHNWIRRWSTSAPHHISHHKKDNAATRHAAAQSTCSSQVPQRPKHLTPPFSLSSRTTRA